MRQRHIKDVWSAYVVTEESVAENIVSLLTLNGLDLGNKLTALEIVKGEI